MCHVNGSRSASVPLNHVFTHWNAGLTLYLKYKNSLWECMQKKRKLCPVKTKEVAFRNGKLRSFSPSVTLLISCRGGLQIDHQFVGKSGSFTGANDRASQLSFKPENSCNSLMGICEGFERSRSYFIREVSPKERHDILESQWYCIHKTLDSNRGRTLLPCTR